MFKFIFSFCNNNLQKPDTITGKGKKIMKITKESLNTSVKKDFLNFLWVRSMKIKFPKPKGELLSLIFIWIYHCTKKKTLENCSVYTLLYIYLLELTFYERKLGLLAQPDNKYLLFNHSEQKNIYNNLHSLYSKNLCAV